ncbi:hypothetical protein [Paramagnetospirillum caucaseum]|uniref:hypothetical protein n=1 Tax=Paramagnetospirillum caucaseum TaxID=1244869 RepID=UPI001267886A|nr:hypothetical protein [Paramagnetospirillum caucaseum]
MSTGFSNAERAGFRTRDELITLFGQVEFTGLAIRLDLPFGLVQGNPLRLGAVAGKAVPVAGAAAMEINVFGDLLGIAGLDALPEIGVVVEAAVGVMDVEHGGLLARRQAVPVGGADLILDLIDAGGDFAVQATLDFGFRQGERAHAGAVLQFRIR